MTAPRLEPQRGQVRPTIEQLRVVCQPESTMSRRNAEHWLARLALRRLSLHVTAVLIRMPVTANQLTGLMIVVGLVAAVPAGFSGWVSAVVCALLVLLYFMLDLCDGEVARWHRTTSVTGVYLDRVGHYLVEAALLCGYGFRAGGQQLGGWTTLGVATGLLVVLIKAETDLVDVARVRSGLAAAPEASAGLRSARLGQLRHRAQVLKVHQITGALESATLLVVAALVDAAAGSQVGSRFLVVAFAVVAASMVIVHLLSVLVSRRLS